MIYHIWTRKPLFSFEFLAHKINTRISSGTGGAKSFELSSSAPEVETLRILKVCLTSHLPLLILHPSVTGKP